VVFGTLVFKLSVWCGAEDYVSGLRAAAAAAIYVANNNTNLMNFATESQQRVPFALFS
jgi:hypothetical protein